MRKWLWDIYTQRGYAPAQGSLSYLYVNGEGVQENKKEAERWIQKAKEDGIKTTD